MRLRLRRPRQLAKDLLAAARRDHEEVADYLETHGEEWEALAEAAPGDAADVLEQLTEEDAAGLLAELEPEEVADILEQIAPELAAELVEDVPIADLTAAVSEMTGEAAADLLYELDDDVTESVLAMLDNESEQEIRRLLEYPSDTAGGLMTTEIAALPLGLTAGEAIERIRQLHEQYEDFAYVYVVDHEQKLKGVIYFRDLVFARPGASLEEVMVPDPVAVEGMTDREEVAELAQRYRLFGIPVIDEQGRLLGVVTTDAVIEAVQDEATEDFAAAVGAGLGETVYTDVTKSFRSRAPWLLLNLVLATVVAWIIERQTSIISSEPVLAALMPIVATAGRQWREPEPGSDDPLPGLGRCAPCPGDVHPASTGRGGGPQRSASRRGRCLSHLRFGRLGSLRELVGPGDRRRSHRDRMPGQSADRNLGGISNSPDPASSRPRPRPGFVDPAHDDHRRGRLRRVPPRRRRSALIDLS